MSLYPCGAGTARHRAAAAGSARPTKFALLLLWAFALNYARAAEPTQIRIEFLAGDAARAAMIGEANESYYKLRQPMEMAAKTGRPVPGQSLDQQRAECRKRYQRAVTDWTPDEKESVQWYVSDLLPATAQYPLFAHTPWSFIKLNGPIEGGQPFTRGKSICLPSSLLTGMVRRRQDLRNNALARRAKDQTEWTALAGFGTLLIHEQCHVLQRQHPENFANLYTDYWGFQYATKIERDDWLTEHQLLDPDGTDTRWVFPIKDNQETRWIWPLVILQDPEGPTGPSFADMRMIAVELEPSQNGVFKVKTVPNGLLVYRGLMREQRYVAVFRPSREIFHPNECSADLFSRIIATQNIPGNPPEEAREGLAMARQLLKPLQGQFLKIMSGASQ
jgi:hypothetical protein